MGRGTGGAGRGAEDRRRLGEEDARGTHGRNEKLGRRKDVKGGGGGGGAPRRTRKESCRGNTGVGERRPNFSEGRVGDLALLLGREEIGGHRLGGRDFALREQTDFFELGDLGRETGGGEMADIGGAAVGVAAGDEFLVEDELA